MIGQIHINEDRDWTETLSIMIGHGPKKKECDWLRADEDGL